MDLYPLQAEFSDRCRACGRRTTALAELLSVPVIVEEVAVAARLKWGMTATAEGRTARHGPITFRVPA